MIQGCRENNTFLKALNVVIFVKVSVIILLAHDYLCKISKIPGLMLF